jgi:Siphovirus Gp157
METLSLFQIESDLAQLCEERDRADGDGDGEAVAVLDGLIKDYLSREATKIDSGAALIRSDTAAAKMLREEAERLLGRAKAFEARAERIKRAWCEAMAAQGIKELKSPHATIRRQGNGGLRPLEIEEAPQQYTDITVVFSYRQWCWVRELIGAFTGSSEGMVIACARSMEAGESEPQSARIRAALERGEEVPGCKLGERGEHLRVS